MADQAYQLVVRKGPRPGEVFPLTLDAIMVGRDPLSDFVINDPEVSRHHAKLTRVGEGFELQDMGSTNGSFVDGKRLGGDPVALRPGQVVMFGSNVTLIYQATSASDPLATMVAPSAIPEIEEEEPEPFVGDLTAPEILPEMPEEEPAPEPEAAQPPMAPLEEEAGLATMLEGPAEVEEAEPLPPIETPTPLPSFEPPPAEVAADAGEPLPDFEPKPVMSPPAPEKAPAKRPAKDSQRNRNILVAVVGAVLVCCCLVTVVVAVLYATGTI